MYSTMKQTHFQCLLHSPLLLVAWLVVCRRAAASRDDKLALLHFKQSITHDPNMVLTSWNDSFHFCNWFGVTCHRIDNSEELLPTSSSKMTVVSLVLERQDLAGTLSPYIGNLTSLRTLSLLRNNFAREIPSQLGNLILLRRLNLSGNSFSGEIPLNLTRCLRLNFLMLEANNLTGRIPPEIGMLRQLRYLRLGTNNLTGPLPPSLGNLSNLIDLAVPYNSLAGTVPESYGRLSSLKMFVVGVNQLSGAVPASLFNLSSLNVMTLVMNQFQGTLPPDIGFTLPNLQMLGISRNGFAGTIPVSLCNASGGVVLLNMNWNHFHGRIPDCLGNLPALELFDAAANNLGRNSTSDFAFMESLANCSRLIRVGVAINNLGGRLPDSVANLSASTLKQLFIGENQIIGAIPAGLENLLRLTDLDFTDNLFTGPVPEFIGKLPNLQRVTLSVNQLSGPIPSSVGNLTELFELDISFNQIQGNLPSDLALCRKLIMLDLSSNKLAGTVPPELLQLASLSKVLNLSRNSFSGHLPAVPWSLQSLTSLDLSHNDFTGEIPAAVGGLQSLVYLYLQNNSFTGNIPDALISLGGIEQIDLFGNNLTGGIPPRLQNIHSLLYLNLSHNDLAGDVPTGGLFANASRVSLSGNAMLCGGVSQLGFPKCRGTQKKKTSRIKLSIIIAAPLFLSLAIAGAAASFYYTSRRRSTNHKLSSNHLRLGKLATVSYADLHRATDGFSPANAIGSGGFGTVFRGVLQHTEALVAIKVLRNHEDENRAEKSLKAEFNALRNARHRNLVRLITYCSSLDYKGDSFRALVYPFMENGSLEKWLHSDLHRLSTIQRLNIALDVATALHYLHELGGDATVVHCDLKPSNVLLDGDMVGHVSDFGLARFLPAVVDGAGGEVSSSVGVRGTIGYAPPEYGMGATNGTKAGDVYSYGILLLELLTGKRPTDESFGGGRWSSLRDSVQAALPNDVYSVLDPKLCSPQDSDAELGRNVGTAIRRSNAAALQHENHCLVSVLEIGLACSAESPRERMKIAEVARRLLSVRDCFLANCINAGRARLMTTRAGE